MLVAAPSKRSAARHQTDEHLEELARLTDTAGAEVVGTLTQQLDRPNPATYLGSGKVEELKASGFVGDELARSGVAATVAPLAARPAGA